MGYFSAGILLQHQPDWPRLASLDPSFGFRGYAHRSHPVWLLEFWTGKSGGEPVPPWPFQQGHETKPMASLPSDDTIDRYAKIGTVNKDAYGERWLRLALAVATTLEQTTFLFAGDDETLDFACLADPGAIRHYAIGLDYGMMQLTGNSNSITIQPFAEDESEFDDVLAMNPWLTKLQDEPSITIEPPAILDEVIHFGNTVTLWPVDGIRPEHLAGIATWDPYANLETDFELVYQRDGQ